MVSQVLAMYLPQVLAIQRKRRFSCGCKRLPKFTTEFKGEEFEVEYESDEVDKHPCFECAREEAIPYCHRNCGRPILVGLRFVLRNVASVKDIHRDAHMIGGCFVACAGKNACDPFWVCYPVHIWNGKYSDPEFLYDALLVDA